MSANQEEYDLLNHHAAKGEKRILELESEGRALRKALEEQWQANHAEHCRNVDNAGHWIDKDHPCDAPPPYGCHWPRPRVLDT